MSIQDQQRTLFVLPDDPFWNQQKLNHFNSQQPLDRRYSLPAQPITRLPSSFGQSQQRRLSRKLPPTLTESLEDITQPVKHKPGTIDIEEEEEDDSPLNVSLAIPVVSKPKNEPFILTVVPPLLEQEEDNPVVLASPISVSPPSSLRKKSIALATISGPSAFRKLSATSPISATAPLTPAMSRSRPDSLTDSFSSPTSCSTASGSSGSASTCGTWSVLDELEFQEQLDKRSSPKESRRDKKLRKKIEDEKFDETSPPSMSQLFEASLMEVIDEKGQHVRFGDLIRHRKTVVIFIRHWFCPLCAQYINSILNQVKIETLEEADVDLLIIGNGSDKMIDGYRNKHFKCPFKMYTDPKLKLYRALGLTRQTGDAGADEDAGDYLVQSGMEATLQTLKRATQMPLRRPGHFLQIGGEFVFDGPLNCVYTHRMTTTRDHAPIRDIVAKAGVQLEFIHYEPGPPPPPVHRESGLDDLDLDKWQNERQAQLDRITALKESRRSGKSGKSLGRLPSVRSIKIVTPEDDDSIVDEFGSLHV